MHGLEREGTGSAITVAAACTFGEMVIYGAGLIATFGVFLQPVSAALGWGRSVMSGGLLLGTVTAALSYPIIGRLIDRFGPRRVLVVGQTLYAVNLASMALLSGSVVQLYFLYALLGIGFALSGQIAYSKTVAAWFGRRRGIMLGVTIGLGNAVGGALAPQLVRRLLDAVGWRQCYIAVGVSVAVLGLTTALFVRMPRGNMQGVPIGSAVREQRASFREFATDRDFWLLVCATIPGGLAAGAILAHGIALLTDRGVTREMATSAISVIALMAIVGRIICGFLLDRVQSSRVAIPFYVFVLLGLILIDHAPSSLLLFSAGVFGLGLAGEGTMLPYFTTRYFGVIRYGQVFGSLYAVVAVTTGLGPLLMGAAFDLTGSYSAMLLLLEAGLVVALWCISILGPYRFPAIAGDER